MTESGLPEKNSLNHYFPQCLQAATATVVLALVQDQAPVPGPAALEEMAGTSGVAPAVLHRVVLQMSGTRREPSVGTLVAMKMMQTRRGRSRSQDKRS